LFNDCILPQCFAFQHYCFDLIFEAAPSAGGLQGAQGCLEQDGQDKARGISFSGVISGSAERALGRNGKTPPCGRGFGYKECGWRGLRV